jgi:hypothetical protein
VVGVAVVGAAVVGVAVVGAAVVGAAVVEVPAVEAGPPDSESEPQAASTANPSAPTSRFMRRV